MKIKYMFFTIIVALLAVTLLFSGCVKNNSEDTKVIKLGVLVPLSGAAASWGQNALAGIKLAVNKLNANGGTDGKKIKLFVEDTKCSADSVNATQKLVNIDNVDAIVGFVCSAAAKPALESVIVPSGKPIVIVAASNPTLTKMGSNIFRVYPSDSAQGTASADFIYNQLKKQKVAVIYVQNQWGQAIAEVFSKRFKELGGKVTYYVGRDQKATDFQTDLMKAKESGAEVLYLPLYPASAIPLVKQFKNLNLNLQILGGDMSGTQEFLQAAFDGIMYMAGNNNISDSIKNKIHQLPEYNNLKINLIAPLGYDAMMVFGNALKKANSTNPNAIIQTLAQTNYQNAESYPTITFDEHGDLKNPAFVVKKVINHTSTVYHSK